MAKLIDELAIDLLVTRVSCDPTEESGGCWAVSRALLILSLGVDESAARKPLTQMWDWLAVSSIL